MNLSFLIHNLPCFHPYDLSKSQASGSPVDELLHAFNTKLEVSSHDDFPFLVDPATVEFVKGAKVMLVMRGLPGSGKSTLGRKILDTYNPNSDPSGTVVCAGDDYFTDPVTGVYNFDGNKLKEAHAAARVKASNACKNSVSPIVIDNTNLTFWEISHYVKIAREHDYLLILVEPRTHFKFDINKLAETNKHQVSKQALKEKLSRYEAISPFYLGWFLNHDDSQAIINLSKSVYGECLKNCEAFKSDLASTTRKANVDELYQFYSQRLHCTSKFVGKDKGNIEARSYVRNRVVENSTGKCFEAKVVGFCFSKNAVAADFQLDPNNKANHVLWTNDLEETRQREIFSEEYFKSLGVKKCKELLKRLHFAYRAHLTCGLAKDQSPVQSGIDLSNCKLRMLNSPDSGLKVTSDHIESIHYLKDTYCYARLKEPRVIKTIFASEY